VGEGVGGEQNVVMDLTWDRETSHAVMEACTFFRCQNTTLRFCSRRDVSLCTGLPAAGATRAWFETIHQSTGIGSEASARSPSLRGAKGNKREL
jgi:hypothetical protein